MKRMLILLPILTFILIGFGTVHAGDIRHTYGGSPLNSFYIDNLGGSVNNGGSNNSYFLNLNDIDQSAFGTLFIYRNDGNTAVVDDGLVDEDFTDLTGISNFPLSVLDPSLLGEIGLADDIPLTPVGFQGQSGLLVEQVSYTSSAPGDNFVIVEYRVVNPGNQPVQAQLALSNDFDVDLKASDLDAGYDNSVAPMVFQQEGLPIDPNFTTIGVALLEGQEAEHRLEICSGPLGSCQIFADDNDGIRKSFFEKASGQVGDLTGGATHEDFAVTIAADLGTLQPQEGKSVVFCYAAGQGNDAATGLSDCQQTATNCQAFYEDKLQKCGNGLTNFGEQCDDGNTNNHDSCPSGVGATCQNAKCGDGFIWDEDGGTEECDDGNTNNNDSCTNACKLAVCGDGFTQPSNGEQCDDGNADTTDSCCNCFPAKCGDGFVWKGHEVCDDSNNTNGDGCSADCQSFESCGNGVLDPGEACDDGNNNTSDNCPSGKQGTCQPAFCGDGYLHVGVEACDDGNNINGDGCSSTCTIEGPNASGNITPPIANPVCGNGIVEVGEECDDGNNKNSDTCSTSCKFLPVLEGGRSSSNSATAPGGGSGGCSLNAGAFASSSAGWVGIAVLSAGLILMRKRKGLGEI